MYKAPFSFPVMTQLLAGIRSAWVEHDDFAHCIQTSVVFNSVQDWHIPYVGRVLIA